MIGKLLKMQLLEDDDELAYTPADKEEDIARMESDGRPAWMRILCTDLQEWARMLPKVLTPLKRTVDNIRDPLFRFFEREVNAGIQLLSDVRCDIDDAIKICLGEKKQTNHHRVLLAALAKSIIPHSWQRYTIPSGTTVINWMIDFNERIKQLHNITQASLQGGTPALKNLNLWLGGMFIPEAYITATRQFVAQANNWSLEELTLQMNVFESKETSKLDDCSFGMTGLRLQGAVSVKNTLQLSTAITTELPLTSLRWIRLDSMKPSSTRVTLPIYLNPTRSQLLFTVDFETSGEGSGEGHSFYERGVALTASNLGGP
jgi:dynein heavy chain 1